MTGQTLTLLTAAGLVGLWVFTGAWRRGRQTARAIRATEQHRVSIAGRGVVAGVFILTGQWWVIRHGAHLPALYWAALGVPALVTGVALARLTAPRVLGRGGARR
jgi:hypothetical protein